MIPRLYLPAAAAESSFSLSDSQSRYLLKVLRMRCGDALIIFDGEGSAYHAEIASTDKKKTVITATTALPAPAPADIGRQLHIGQMICAPAKMDWAIEKMTELGVTIIAPLYSHNKKHQPEEKLQQRWRRLAAAACAQCGRNRLPVLLPCQPVTAWQPPAHCRRVLLTPNAEQALAGFRDSPVAIAVAVGGESGFTMDEERHFIDTGFEPAHLGTRVLRSETAAMAALALLNN